MRKLSVMMLMILLAVMLTACGDDEEAEDEPTEGEVSTEVVEEQETEGEVDTEVVEELETEDATEAADIAVVEDDDGTPELLITPESVGTPIVSASPVVTASPVSVVAAAASPVAAAIPDVIATPVEDSVVVVSPQDDAAEATPSEMLRGLSGQVVLPGAVNETFIITDEGCVGLGEYSDIRAGRQVVVRDEADTIIGVTTLEASSATDTCAWNFTVEVPPSDFYAVSIPMEAEHILTSAEVEENDGEITISLR